MKQVTLIAAFASIASFCQAAPIVTDAPVHANRSFLFQTSYRSFFSSTRNEDPAADERAVRFAGFSAALRNGAVSVQWSALKPATADLYEIERSEDGRQWRTIAYVGAIGDPAQMSRYSFTDKGVNAPVVHYRVKEVNNNGKVTYTSVRSVRVIASEAPVTVTAAPNRLVLRFANALSGSVRVQVVRPDGSIASEQSLASPSGTVILPTGLKGNYFVSVSSAAGLQAGQSIIL